MSLSTSEVLTVPVEAHIFKHDGDHYVFDVRNFTILKLDALGAAILERLAVQPLAEIVEELAGTAPPAAIQRHYLRLLDMVGEGALSSEPIPRPERPPFSHLVVMLAGGCNMACRYCFEQDVPIYQKPNRLSREQADKILDWFFRHQEGPGAHVQLYGGEPLLNWPVLQYVVEQAETRAAEKGITLAKYLITNGTLLNPERITWLREHGVTIQVSVDGEEKAHDRFRVFKSGKPTMAAIRPNIDELQRQRADYNLRAVVTRENRDPGAVIKGLRSLGATNVSFEVVATDARPAQFTDEDWAGFNIQYADYVDNSFSTWAELPDEMKSIILKICQRQRVLYGCGAGIGEVTVAPDGSIFECQRIYRQSYSNIAEDRSPTQLDSRFLTMVDDRPVCRDCWARYLCGGGCMQQAFVGHGSDEPLPQYCQTKRTLVEASIVRIAEIRAQQRKADI